MTYYNEAKEILKTWDKKDLIEDILSNMDYNEILEFVKNNQEVEQMECCWNEEKEEYYEIESIGVNKYRCLGCYNEVE